MKGVLPYRTKAGVLDFKNDERAFLDYEREVWRRAWELLGGERKLVPVKPEEP